MNGTVEIGLKKNPIFHGKTIILVDERVVDIIHVNFVCRFYWAINLGALVAYTAIAYICQYGMGAAFGGVAWGFFVGYSIPVITMG